MSKAPRETADPSSTRMRYIYIMQQLVTEYGIELLGLSSVDRSLSFEQIVIRSSVH